MDGQQENTLRQRVEREIRGILRDEYGLSVDRDMPLKYYLDFKTDRRLLDLAGVLERMERGTFGVCMICGATIPDARLAASPVSRLCDACIPGKRNPVSIPAADRLHTVQQPSI